MEYEPTMKKCETCGDFDFINEIHKCEEMETCLICFDDYKINEYHQCKENWFCNACAEYCSLEDGKVTLEKNEVVFTHSAKLCGAQDEKEENELWEVLYHHQEQFTETAGVDGQEKENEMHQLFIDIIREAIDKAEKESN